MKMTNISYENMVNELLSLYTTYYDVVVYLLRYIENLEIDNSSNSNLLIPYLKSRIEDRRLMCTRVKNCKTRDDLERWIERLS